MISKVGLSLNTALKVNVKSTCYFLKMSQIVDVNEKISLCYTD